MGFSFEKPATASVRVARVRPDLKHFAVVRHILQKFTTDGNMVIDRYMGTGATAKACLLEAKHRTCISYDSNGKST